MARPRTPAPARCRSPSGGVEVRPTVSACVAASSPPPRPRRHQRRRTRGRRRPGAAAVTPLLAADVGQPPPRGWRSRAVVVGGGACPMRAPEGGHGPCHRAREATGRSPRGHAPIHRRALRRTRPERVGGCSYYYYTGADGRTAARGGPRGASGRSGRRHLAVAVAIRRSGTCSRACCTSASAASPRPASSCRSPTASFGAAHARHARHARDARHARGVAAAVSAVGAVGAGAWGRARRAPAAGRTHLLDPPEDGDVLDGDPLQLLLPRRAVQAVHAVPARLARVERARAVLEARLVALAARLDAVELVQEDAVLALHLRHAVCARARPGGGRSGGSPRQQPASRRAAQRAARLGAGRAPRRAHPPAAASSSCCS